MCRNEKVPVSMGLQAKTPAKADSRAYGAMRLVLLALLVWLGLRFRAEMHLVEEGDGADGSGVVLKLAFGQPVPPSQPQSPSSGLEAPPPHSGFGGDAPAAAVDAAALGAAPAELDAGVRMNPWLDVAAAHPSEPLAAPATAVTAKAKRKAAKAERKARYEKKLREKKRIRAEKKNRAQTPPLPRDYPPVDAAPAGLGGAAGPPAEHRPAPATTETTEATPPPAPKTKKRVPYKKKKRWARKQEKKQLLREKIKKKTRPILSDFPPVERRLDFIRHLETLPTFATAIEVGAGTGILAKTTLELWASCTEYKLVDVWETEEALAQARYRVRPWPETTEFLFLPPAEAAARLADAHFDFAYLHTRRKDCAATERLARYWPKLRPGGILGGSGYAETPPEEWGRCEDGNVRPEATKGAVDDFRKEQGDLDIYLSDEKLPSWYIQKPY